MALPIRSFPVLEGEVARRFLREAKANEKKRGTRPIPEEDKIAYKRIMEDYRRRHAEIALN